MSWKESFWSGQSQNGKAATLPLDFKAKYPTLAEVLEGEGTGTKENPATPACSVVLFAEGDRLKFCITPRVGNRVGFGCVREAVRGLEGLESELSGGSVEWKLSKR